MPILAMIEVHECDKCRTVISVNRLNNESEKAFKSWYDGLTYSFCPKCKNTGFAKVRIAGINQVLANIEGEKPNVPSH